MAYYDLISENDESTVVAEDVRMSRGLVPDISSGASEGMKM